MGEGVIIPRVVPPKIPAEASHAGRRSYTWVVSKQRSADLEYQSLALPLQCTLLLSLWR